MGKGENAGYQHFRSLFLKAFLHRVVDTGDCVEKVESFTAKFRVLKTLRKRKTFEKTLLEKENSL